MNIGFYRSKRKYLSLRKTLLEFLPYWGKTRTNSCHPEERGRGAQIRRMALRLLGKKGEKGKIGRTFKKKALLSNSFLYERSMDSSHHWIGEDRTGGRGDILLPAGSKDHYMSCKEERGVFATCLTANRLAAFLFSLREGGRGMEM